MDEVAAQDRIDTLRWVALLMDTTVSTNGADTEKSLIFLSEVIATVYIIRGSNTANQFVIDFAAAVHYKVNSYKERKDTDFVDVAKTHMKQENEMIKIAKIAQRIMHEIIPASERIKKDSMLSIFAGVYLSSNARRVHPIIMALCMCTSYVLASANNTQDLNDLSELIMDSITDKLFQETVKRLVDFEDSLPRLF